MLANVKRVRFSKNKNDLYEENSIFQKIGEYPLNIAHMLIILHIKNKCNIPYNLHVYKTFTN